MRVLAIVAHPDDEILGCGATLRRLANEGHEVYACVLCSSADARFQRPSIEQLREVSDRARDRIGVRECISHDLANIRFNVVPHLDMVRSIEEAIIRFEPSWVFTHHPADLNIDHRVCYDAAMAACMLPQRLSSSLSPSHIRRIMLFEVLSSTDWAPPMGDAFRPNMFVDVEQTFNAKVEALEMFEGALKPFPHSRSIENVRHLAHLRAAQAGLTLAEAFCVVRDIY